MPYRGPFEESSQGNSRHAPAAPHRGVCVCVCVYLCMCVYVWHTVALACAPETCGGKRTLLDTLLAARPSPEPAHRDSSARLPHSAWCRRPAARKSRALSNLATESSKHTRPGPLDSKSLGLIYLPILKRVGPRMNRCLSAALSFRAGRRGAGADPSRLPLPRGNTAGITSVRSEHDDGRWKML